MSSSPPPAADYAEDLSQEVVTSAITSASSPTPSRASGSPPTSPNCSSSSSHVPAPSSRPSRFGLSLFRPSTTFGSWLRERSKLTKSWKRLHRSGRSGVVTRALPPVPSPSETPNNESSSPPPPAPLASSVDDLTLRLDQLAPNTAYLPEGDEDEAAFPQGDPNHQTMDVAKSLEAVKSYGWYWGPISGEDAERLLSLEPDGSFVVRDSSDDHYIFSLTFKLNNSVRHVRIEHDQGNFSFGAYTKFKSNTIVDFIENAVEHSRSGRYLFFLHRRPVLGPLRVQLLHPVSRFKTVQSLQHQCRFAILRLVPRDLLHKLPVPPKIQDYLNTSFYYSEMMDNLQETSAAAPTEDSSNNQ